MFHVNQQAVLVAQNSLREQNGQTTDTALHSQVSSYSLATFPGFSIMR